MRPLPHSWNDNGTKLTVDALKTLEAHVSRPLPEDYRQLLIDHGSVWFGMDSKYFDVAWSRLNGQDLSTSGIEALGPEMAIFGLSSTDGIERMLGDISRGSRIAGGAALPDHYFPFAEDHFGAMIVFDLSPERHGQVYAWWPRSDRWGEGENQYIGFVADSLDDFLFNRLRDESTDDFAPGAG